MVQTVVGPTNLDIVIGADGSTSAPTFSFESSLDTGMYYIASDRIGFVGGGLTALMISSTLATFSGDITSIQAGDFNIYPQAGQDLVLEAGTSKITVEDDGAISLTAGGNLSYTISALGNINFDEVIGANGGFHEFKNAQQLNDANQSVTGADMFAGMFYVTPTANRVYTTGTGTQINAAMVGSGTGSSFTFTIVCLAAFNATLAAGAGVTLSGNLIANNASATYRVIRTSATTVDIYRI